MARKDDKKDEGTAALFRAKIRTSGGQEATSLVAVVVAGEDDEEEGKPDLALYRFKVRTPDGREITSKVVVGRNKKLKVSNLRWGNKLPPALLELAVLFTARRWNCQHEWYMHEKLARKAGLEPRIFDAIATGSEPQGMSSDESLVYKACRQAHESGRLDEDTFGALRDRFGLDGVLDLLVLNGYYSAMAMVLNTAGMPLPDGAVPPLRSG